MSSIPRALLRRRAYRALSKRAFISSSRASADQVRIVEVGPRDGLQNEKNRIPVETKVELVRRLARTGLETIEAGSFVAPKWVPQMAASDQVLSSILSHLPPASRPITYQWLLPNMRGLDNFCKVMQTSSSAPDDAAYPTPPPSPPSEMQDTGPALNTSTQDPNEMLSSSSSSSSSSPSWTLNTQPAQDSASALNTSTQNPNEMPSSTSGMDSMHHPRTVTTPPQPHHEVSIFLAATETFSQRNTHCSIQESLDRFAPLIAASRKHGYPVRAYISVALGCPFEGPDTDPHKVAELATSLLEMGADEISVADTTGMGTAPRTRHLLQTLRDAGIQSADLAMHFHDTFGQALINTMVSLDHGVRTFDSAVGGLGGCPYSPGATGNVATEDLVYCLHSLGAKTGVDLEEMSRIGDWITGEIGKENSSSAGKATLARLRRKNAGV